MKLEGASQRLCPMRYDKLIFLSFSQKDYGVKVVCLKTVIRTG